VRSIILQSECPEYETSSEAFFTTITTPTVTLLPLSTLRSSGIDRSSYLLQMFGILRPCERNSLIISLKREILILWT